MEAVIGFLRDHEEILLFLVIALGYALGHIKLGWFKLGTTAGTLIVGLFVGLAQFEVSPLIKSIGFGIFIYAVGLRVGPQFFAGMKKDGLKFISQSLVTCAAGFVIVWLCADWLKLAPGIAPGIIAGAMTNTSTLGAATQAISSGTVSLPAGVSAQVASNNVAVTYAITYLFGTVGLIVFYKLLPRMFGYNLAQEAQKLQQEMSQGVAEPDPESAYFSEYHLWDLRCFELTNPALAGKSLAELGRQYPLAVAIERIKRGDRLIEAAPELVLQLGDLVALSGRINLVAQAAAVIGPEKPDQQVLDMVAEDLEILVTNQEAVNKTLAQVGSLWGRGCYLKKLLRSGVEQEVNQGLTLHKGDLLVVSGISRRVDNLAQHLGYAVRRSATTDLLTLAVGLVLGGLLGAVTVKIWGVPVSLGSAGGLLLTGIIISFLRSRHPTFGNIPGAARGVLEDIGLTLFVAVLGLGAGHSVLDVLRSAGLPVFLVGVAVTLVPALCAWLWGRYVLRLNPVIAIGACTGCVPTTAALQAVMEEADSALPALGYPVPYAVSTVVLTVLGFLIMQVV
ncbi:MAG: TrkA C-terminal domain-containing protein [Thermodesulfobacteriota bacterium]